jgi:hypothetical protein
MNDDLIVFRGVIFCKVAFHTDRNLAMEHLHDFRHQQQKYVSYESPSLYNFDVFHPVVYKIN